MNTYQVSFSSRHRGPIQSFTVDANNPVQAVSSATRFLLAEGLKPEYYHTPVVREINEEKEAA